MLKLSYIIRLLIYYPQRSQFNNNKEYPICKLAEKLLKVIRQFIYLRAWFYFSGRGEAGRVVQVCRLQTITPLSRISSYIVQLLIIMDMIWYLQENLCSCRSFLSSPIRAITQFMEWHIRTSNHKAIPNRKEDTILFTHTLSVYIMWLIDKS